jgi:peptidoglycan/xylan/chitin deacetylase (PgdA/CDA1 family)
MARPERSLAARGERARRRVARRRRVVLIAAVIAVVAVAAALALAACGGGGRHDTGSGSPQAGAPDPPSSSPAARQAGIPAPQPGKAKLIRHGAARPEIALTFDDGFCKACVARTIAFLARSGTHATIFPNGRYAASWAPQARTIRRLLAKGQLLVGNHTFLHHDPVAESAKAFRTDLLHDESWIERTFGVTARPFFRPPYGAHNASTIAIAGRSGFTKVITWSGTVADSSPRTVSYIVAAIRHWAAPGAIILMHANYPATSAALPQIVAILHQRGLRPVTLKELLG